MRSFGDQSGIEDPLRGRFAAAAVLFAVLVLAIILVFGHFISRSLSNRYLEDVLISGREGAEEIAEELGGENPEEVFNVFEKRREVLVRTLGGLPQRQVWETAEVVDREGNVVYTLRFQTAEEIPEELASHLELSGVLSDQEVTETENSYRVEVPLGEVGSVVFSASKGRIAERVVRLRRELLGQTYAVAAVTLVTLTAAFLLVWRLIQRTRRLEKQRHEAQELADLGVLAANLAHEIRNPLNSINLNLELLEEDLEGSAGDSVDSLVKTRSEVGRLGRLVSDFLTYARPTPLARETVLASELLGEVREFLRGEVAGLGVHLRLANQQDERELHCDPAQIRQVLLNLVLNAAQAVEGLEAERRVVELATQELQEEGSFALIVRDRGDGIAPERLSEVKRAFFTSRRGGTGLGLAIAERIVLAHGGEIQLENMNPRGFEARVVLPIAEEDGKMSRGSARAQRGVPQGGSA